MSELVVPRRFCGPPQSGNGGWTAGTLAARHLDASPHSASPAGRDGHPWVQVTLRTPPPLDTPLRVRHRRGVTDLHDGATLVGEAETLTETGSLDRRSTWVPPVSPEQAEQARAAFPPAHLHPFGTCFVCGPERAEGDGMRLFTGRVPGDDRVAAPWTPPAEAATGPASMAFTWSALDCPSAWADDFLRRPMVLGRMSARTLRRPEVGVEHVVVARALLRDGRRTHTASALYTRDGEAVAVATHVWFAIDPATFG